ncbi:MAG: SCP2 sterol-binding domain-containing protein [Bdellovibrionales bacterium]
MKQDRLPPPLARAALKAIPSSLLQRMIDVLLRKLRSQHPHLFKNLERLDSATVRIEPSDVAHRFVISFGKNGVSLTVADKASDACIKGSVAALLNMLEGRIDGDKLFFSRDIEISGKTDVVVALRNTLDREEINMLDDIASLFGPFAYPARQTVLLADAVARHLRQRFESQRAAAS